MLGDDGVGVTLVGIGEGVSVGVGVGLADFTCTVTACCETPYRESTNLTVTVSGPFGASSGTWNAA